MKNTTCKEAPRSETLVEVHGIALMVNIFITLWTINRSCLIYKLWTNYGQRGDESNIIPISKQ
ncbi:hypothetical protein CR513_40388, partial [Mucuna pruriens]